MNPMKFWVEFFICSVLFDGSEHLLDLQKQLTLLVDVSWLEDKPLLISEFKC